MRRVQNSLSLPSPFSRRYRDDLTVEVIFFGEGDKGGDVSQNLEASNMGSGTKPKNWSVSKRLRLRVIGCNRKRKRDCFVAREELLEEKRDSRLPKSKTWNLKLTHQN